MQWDHSGGKEGMDKIRKQIKQIRKGKKEK